jgi:hypothetical protein
MTYLSRAVNSRDLSHKEERCDTDTLQAAGMAAAASKSDALGVLLRQAFEGCAGDSSHSSARVRELESEIALVVRGEMRRTRLKVDILPVAALIVRELLLCPCPRCQGRGFLPLAYGDGGTDELSGEDCPLCLGSGRAAVDYKSRAKAAGVASYTRDLALFWEAVLKRIAYAELCAWAKMRDKLRSEGS